MRSARWASVVACLLVAWVGTVQAADYPLTLTASAQVVNGPTTVTSMLTVRVDRLMAEMNRTTVTDALKFGGYGNFLPALRKLPVVGTVEFNGRKVELRYAREQKTDKGRRLTLVADTPLFFLGEATKARAGYELTVVDVTLDDKSAGTGTMAGAARVKPTPDGGVILDDFAAELVQLTVKRAPEK